MIDIWLKPIFKAHYKNHYILKVSGLIGWCRESCT